MYRLRPVGLDEFGLEEALQHLVEGWQQQRPDVRYTLAIEADLPPLDEALNIAVFRMVQESLTNVARHSGATAAAVRLGLDGPTRLLLQVEDNGCGVPPAVRPGLGLTGMRERAELHGGHMRLSAGAGSQDAPGTLLEFRLPLSKHDGADSEGDEA